MVGRVEYMAMAQDMRTLHDLEGPVEGEQIQLAVLAVTCCLITMIRQSTKR